MQHAAAMLARRWKEDEAVQAETAALLAIHAPKLGNCEHCGKKMRNPRTHQRFCDSRCRNAAWRANHPRRKRSPRKPRIPFELRVFFESIIEF